MRTKQKGIAVLILCHFFLLAALALSMAGYSGVFTQYKRGQSEIEYRKRFWLAEAGLECAFALFASQSVTKSMAMDKQVSECSLPLTVEVTWVLDMGKSEKQYSITSTVGSLSLYRQLLISEKPKYRVEWVAGSWRDFN